MHSFSNLRKSALQAYIDAKQRKRKVTLRLAVIIVLSAVLVVSGAVYAVAAIASDPELKTRILNPEIISPITSLFDESADEESQVPVGNPGAGAAPALPSPLPTGTPIPTITATSTSLFTDTPIPTATFTYTPTVTLTPSITLTPSSTFTPTPTGSGEPLPTSTPTFTPAPTEITFPGCSPSGNSGFDSALMGLINAEREDAGLAAYAHRVQLSIAAQVHSTDMACNGFFSHTGSDGSNVGDRIAAQGYSASSSGENIFRTADTSSSAPQIAFDFWMASPPTRAVILHEDYSEIGISYIYESSSPFGGYFTVVFAQP